MRQIELIKQLRQETGLSVMECKKALEQAKSDLAKARVLLKAKSKIIAAKKSERAIKAGIIDCYLHPNRKIGAMVKLGCESDFVAKSLEFQTLAHELCLQVAAMESENKASFLAQPWIKDSSKTIQQLVQEASAKLGEKIGLEDFVRFKI